MPSLNFTLIGHDALSRVLDRVGDSAQRLHRRINDATTSAGNSLSTFTRDTTTRMSRMQRDTDAGAKALEELRKTTQLLAPAAIPAAASLVPIAAGAATVGAAVAAMGAALVPQISALGDIAEAQKKYDDAVQKNGAHSKEAVTAQAELAQTVGKVPRPTREAAAAVGVLKDEYKDLSDSLAGDTMAPFTKGVALANALLPKTTGLVKASSDEADRFIGIIGGEMASPGLDRLTSEFTSFAQKTLRSVNDEIVHLLRTADEGDVGGPAREFMAWARAQGPAVGDVLRDVALALVHVLEAGSDVGVGLLQVVGVLAHLASAVPPSAISTFLQLAVALKLTKAAALGLAAGRTAIAGVAAQLLAMQGAASGAPTRLRAVGIAIGAMSRSAKVAVAGTGIGLLILALTELSQNSRSTPPDVDKLTNSLRQLGATGKTTGEAAKAFGSDLGGLYDKVRSLTDPSTTDKVQQFIVSIGGLADWDSTPVKDAKANIDAIDKSLAGLVQNGQADLAAAALKRLTAEYGKGGRDTSEFTSKLNDYKDALADSRFEAELTAQSQGIFGAQAQAVQAKLTAQKTSADALRQSLQALNDVNRAGLGGMIGFEAAIDAAAKGAKDYNDVLSMSNGQLSIGTDKQRQAAQLLSDLAAKTEDAAASQRDAGASWETVNGIYQRGRDSLIANARAMGLNKAEAAALADQILKIPDRKARVSMETEDARGDLDAFIGKVQKSPSSKSVTLKTLSGAAEKILEAFGYRVTHLKDGSVTVSATTGTALNNLYAVKRARDALSDKNITITTNRVTRFTSVQGGTVVAKRDYARGGRVRGYAGGGDVQYFPDGGYVTGPGTATSDSIWAAFASGARARVSNTEYVVRSAAVAKYGVPFLDAINSGQLNPALVGVAGFAGGGLTGAGADAARGLAQGLTGSTTTVDAAARSMAAAVTAGVKAELEIASPSKKMKALAADIGKGLIIGLTGSRDKIKATAADLSKDIKEAFSGKKESRLLAMVSRETKKLQDLATKRDKLAARIAEAKQYAGDLTKNARQQASLSGLGMSPEEVTAGRIKSGLQSKLAQIKRFSSYISTLAKRGLSKSLLRQVLDMGPIDGYAYASALAGADKATFNSINAAQKQIDSESTKLGRQGADILYDSGKNAGKGFLAGLAAQQKDIEKLMLKIAKGMEKSIKKALGIKSPSTVLAKLGVYSAQGLARGLLEGLPHVDRALDVVTGRVAATRPVIGRPAVVASSGQVPTINITINGALDPYSTARELDKVLSKYRRGRGGAGYTFAT
ncbi:hypothetical protein [Streptomyces sp. SCL15-4]|uniref:hypothetical protein n=1 Tax=Streptomyces sp. SCL15-4 TaxID=2967221 RepID=UPI002966B968|nr:hypothetical protein [Streptomyces sp. SCL15-4]